MSKQSEAVISWRKRTKQRMVEAMGGKCVECGYSNSTAAFDFHHLNPESKEFGMGGMRANPVAWEKIVQELRKCALLCANCHREVEAGERILKSSQTTFDESFVVYSLTFSNSKRKLRATCTECSIEFSARGKRDRFCSDVCKKIHYKIPIALASKVSQRPRKTAWPEKDVLRNDMATLTWVAMGKKYDVSDNAVRKWAKSYNLL